MTDITMPRLSDSMEEGTILTWLKHTGDAVAEGEELVEIETDKATMTYESPRAGVITILAEEGTSLPVGALIATLGVAVAEPASSARDEAPAGSGRAAPPAPPAGNGTIRSTPLARRLAAVHGIDLGSLEGTGPRGRVTRADVASKAGLEVAAPEASHPIPAADGGGEDGISQDLTRLQQVVARRMAEVKATVPDFHVQAEVQMDAANALRAQLKAIGADVAPSINDIIVKAAALALRRWPRANASYKDGRFELHSRVNVGVAVAAQDALIVPTITDADMRSLGSIASETRRLAERVRNGGITPQELSGATFTVSNLGMYGMTAIFPVINPPQAAILGVGAGRPQPAVLDGALVERQVMTLTLTCDHRILYGADAAQFLSTIRELLEAPLRLAL